MKETIYTQNRELSWLRFNERVLEEATEEGVPAFERLNSMEDKLPEQRLSQVAYEPFVPQLPKWMTAGESIMQKALSEDLFLSYPYDQMTPFLQLRREAANDPGVVSIKITIYRLANKAALVDYLRAAAENGKDVTVIMELRARFDEANNINWSESLEDAGCTVIYGLKDYKVHSKVCLITLMDKGRIKRITQVGTGNYNEKTAKLYTDMSLITSDKDIGNDVATYFKNMSIGNLNGQYDQLLVAPNSMKNKIIALIQGETEKAKRGKPAKIMVKINSLTDRETIDALKDASQAGVWVDMIIRGICCILPDIEGYTDNIKVTSVVGRFLEHSRVYCFGVVDEMQMYISSADFMTRNLRYDGLYEKKRVNEEPVDCQQELIKRAIMPGTAYSHEAIEESNKGFLNWIKKWFK